MVVTSSTAQTEKRMRKILIMGLPGAGKTTLATSLAPLLNAVVFNADAVRANISCDLGFSHADRIEQARRMGWLCDRVVEAGALSSPISSAQQRRRAPLLARHLRFGSTASAVAASRTPIACSFRPRASIFASAPRARRDTGPSKRLPACAPRSTARKEGTHSPRAGGGNK